MPTEIQTLVPAKTRAADAISAIAAKSQLLVVPVSNV
jgi:hypothetical protein